VSCGLHDVLAFEEAQRPAVLVGSDVFEKAAADQAAKLGAPDLRRVFVPHPVQDRTDDEMRAMARAVVAEIKGALT
jgi:hypothetical protein